MKIAFANDHAGVEMRPIVLDHLRTASHEILDFGTDSTESVDYPDMARPAVEAVRTGEADLAVLVCGTGIGMSIAANKFHGIRAALCCDEYSAKLARAHNNANVLALRGREMDPEANRRIIDAFLGECFQGGRHARRIEKITGIEAADQPLKENETNCPG